MPLCVNLSYPSYSVIKTASKQKAAMGKMWCLGLYVDTLQKCLDVEVMCIDTATAIDYLTESLHTAAAATAAPVRKPKPKRVPEALI